MQQPIADLPHIKKLFYAMRNGIVADTLRKQGAPYRMIYGVNIPHLSEIAGQVSHDAHTAQALWDDRSVRESVLLAPMVYPRDEYSIGTAINWIRQAPSTEAIDILCHRLIQHCQFAYELSESLSKSDSNMERYASLRIMFNLLPSHMDEAKEAATQEMGKTDPLTYHISRQLLDEIEYIAETQV